MTMQQFDQPWRLMNWNCGEGRFAIDMFETDGEVVVHASVGGMGSEVQITASGDMLLIRAATSSERQEAGPDYVREERAYSTVSRTIPLPAKVDAEQAQAIIAGGVLIVRLPKLRSGESKTVDVPLRAEG
jgi:HSP20 family protein